MRVHVVVPAGFDDPGRPSGGNNYDRRMCAGLVEAGWDVQIHAVPMSLPGSGPTGAGGTELTPVMAAIPDGETVLIDGLLASPAASQLLPHMPRLRVTVLLHMPLATALDGYHDCAARRSERAVLGAAAGVVVTSEWTRRQVVDRFAIPAERVHLAHPGTDLPGPAPGRSAAPPADGRLLCVAALAPHKGQDLLIEALAGLAGTDWRCVLAGPLDRDPEFTGALRARIARRGLAPRVRLVGVLTGAALHRAYCDADLLVAPSRSETYGMVVTEALARGLPVVAAAVGGLPEALGRTADGIPGMLVAPEDPTALTAALACWLRDDAQRSRLRAAAARRRLTLPRWSDSVRQLAAALAATSSP